MKTNMNPKLLPCAHCGSTDIHLRRDVIVDDGNLSVVWWAECYDCGIRTSPYSEDCNSNDSLDDVMTATDDAITCVAETWNKRTSSVAHANKVQPNDVDLDKMEPSELSSLGKRITDALVNKASHLLDAIEEELNKND